MKTYKEGLNQCLYCEFGSDENGEEVTLSLMKLIFIKLIIFQFLDDMSKHLSDNHANKLGFICRRLPKIITLNEIKDDETETLENQTRIEYVGASSFKIKSFKGSLSNSAAAEEIDDRLEKEEPENSNENEILEIDENVQEVDLTNLETNSISNDTDIPKPSTIPIISEIIHIDNF